MRKWANGSTREKLSSVEPYYNTLEYRHGRLTSCTVCGGKGETWLRADLRIADGGCPSVFAL